MVKLKDFQQGVDLGIYRLGNVRSGGVCASLCLQYLIQRSRGNDFWPWLATPLNKAKVINTLSGKDDVNLYMADIYKTMNAEFDPFYTAQGASFTEIFDLMTDGTPDENGQFDGPYRYVIFEAPQFLFFPGVGHAVALTISATNLRFFDPDHGEWEFNNRREFFPWIGSFFRRHYHYRFHTQGIVTVHYLDPKES